MNMFTISIPKSVHQRDELVAIPKRELADLIARASGNIAEKDILRWSREARSLKREGKLPVLRNVRGL